MRKLFNKTLSVLFILSIIASFYTTAFAASGFTTECPFKGESFTHDAANADAQILPMLDISEFQGKVNFYKLKQQGIHHVILRCGHRYSSSGVIGEDARLYENIENAIAAGMQIGFYVFSQALNTQEAIEEAQFVLSRVEPYREAVTMPIFMDYEFYSGNPNGRLSTAVGNGTLNKAKMTENAVAFCECVLSAGYRAGVYANASFYTDYLNGDKLYENGYEIWYAHYTNDITKFHFWGNEHPVYRYWQYGGTEIEGCCGDPASALLRVKSGTLTGYISVADVAFTAADACVVSAEEALVRKGTAATSPLAATLHKADALQILSYCNAVATDTNFYYYRAAAALTKPSLSLSLASSTGIHLSWNAVDGAAFYRVYAYDVQSGSYSLLTKTTQTSFLHKGLNNAKTYTYLVRAFDSNGIGNAYSVDDTQSISFVPAAPAVTLSAQEHQVTLSWQAANNASYYLLYAVNAESGSMTPLGTTDALSYTVGKLEAQTTYSFLVLAANDYNFISDFKAEDIVSITTPAEPAVPAERLQVTLKAATNTVTLSWNRIAEAAYYRVYSFNAASGKYTRLAQTAGISWQHTRLNAGKAYTYLVCYFNAEGQQSEYSEADLCTVQTLPAAPQVKTALLNEHTVTLSWAKVSGAAYYKVYLYNEKTGKYTSLSKTTALKYTYTKAKYGGQYTFLVRAFLANGSGSSYTAANRKALKVVIAKPAFQLTSPKKGTVKLTWSKVPMAAYYRVYRYQNGKYKALATVKTLSCTAKGFASGKKAAFLVKAYTASAKAASHSVKDVKSVKVK